MVDPQVAYKETIRKAVKTEGKFVRQSGGRGHTGMFGWRLNHWNKVKGYEFVNKIVGGVIPKEFISAVDTGV